MSFVSLAFLAFFAVLWVAYWSLGRRAQNLLLVGASLVFYGWVDPRLDLLLAFEVFVGYGCALQIRRQPARKGRWLTVAVFALLGALGFFKYLGFAEENLQAVLDLLGVQVELPVLRVLLPLGISFYTFQTLAYVIDVYWGKVKAREDLLDVAAYLSFFPLLVSGPIERASRVLPQMEKERAFRWEAMRGGLSLALWGAVQKIVLADTLSPYVNAAYAVPSPDRVLAWSAAAGFTVQMVADFSGYSNLARGIARMLGFEVVRNFRHPYLATDPQDFWRRWHLSLSDWLRDYVFNPLYAATAKRSRGLAMAVATVGTMLLSGLWHGAAWHYVGWGALWAVALLVQAALPKATPPTRARWLAQIAAMSVFNVVAHQLFREADPARLATYFAGAPWDGTHASWVLATVLAGLWGLAALVLALGGWAHDHLDDALRAHRYRRVFDVTAWSIGVAVVYVFAQTEAADFLYFQF